MQFPSADGNISYTHWAEGIAAADGVDFVQLLSDGGSESPVPYPVDENNPPASVLEVLPQHLTEVVHLELQGGPLGNAFVTRDAFNMQINC